MNKNQRILLTAIGGPAAICFAKSLSRIKGAYLVGIDAVRPRGGEKLVNKFYKLPLANDNQFIHELQKVVQKEHIQHIIPLVDEDLLALSTHEEEIDCHILISPWETIEYTNDKNKLYQKLGAFLPRRFQSADARFPLFVKPNIGRGGKDCHIVKDMSALGSFDADKYIYQEILQKPEITVDALFDLEGRPLIVVPRVRIEVMNGVSVSGTVVFHAEVMRQVEAIAQLLKFIGPINFQFMKSSNGFTLTEINARSSGGMGITVNSGADIPRMTYDLLVGNKVVIPQFKRGTFDNFNEVIKRQRNNLKTPISRVG